MKKCPKCQQEKPDSEFAPNPTTGKLQAYCSPCRAEYGRKRYRDNPERERARQKQWRQRNWDASLRSQYKWRKANPEMWKEGQKRWRVKYANDYMRKQRGEIRRKVFDHYGWKCVCCGENQELFLTIDHVGNDGAKHRRMLSEKVIGHGGSGFFKWIVRNDFPVGLQTLCRNCNWGKHANGGICPHQSPEGSTTRAAARSAKRHEARGTPEGVVT